MPRRALTAGQGGVGSFHLSQKGGDMRFGNDDVGSSFPPRDEHDESANAKFNLIPRTVTIAEGASSPTTSSCDSDSTSRRCTTWEDTRRHRRPVPVHQRERGPGRHGTARERLTGHGDVADTRRYVR